MNTQEKRLAGEILIGEAMWEEIGFPEIPVVADRYFREPCPEWAAWKWLYLVGAEFTPPAPMPEDTADAWQDALYQTYAEMGYQESDVDQDVSRRHSTAHRLMQMAYNAAADMVTVPDSVREIIAPRQRPAIR